jgi:hypothetical protein
VQLLNPDRAWRVWTRGEAVKWAWPPDVIERQDDAIMHDITELSGLSAYVARLMELERKPHDQPAKH